MLAPQGGPQLVFVFYVYIYTCCAFWTRRVRVSDSFHTFSLEKRRRGNSIWLANGDSLSLPDPSSIVTIIAEPYGTSRDTALHVCLQPVAWSGRYIGIGQSRGICFAEMQPRLENHARVLLYIHTAQKLKLLLRPSSVTNDTHTCTVHSKRFQFWVSFLAAARALSSAPPKVWRRPAPRARARRKGRRMPPARKRE